MQRHDCVAYTGTKQAPNVHYFRVAVRAFGCEGGPLSLDAILKGYVNDSSMATGSLYNSI